MLELLRHDGQEVLGVDTDAGMVDVCTKKGLPAVVDDGIHFLSQAEENSLKGIFCAQVVEHLITPELEQLVRLALRALRTSGVLVIETINPRSSFAIGNHFYADTSHVRPVHPETLRFICQQVGFSRVQLEERSPHPTLALSDRLPDDALGEAVDELLRNVFGYQDYVIVATK
jgi:2-polyprenyl-3-methyl-5-hydroxy-6-metoxy-1,4-benzoquinol methylase